MKYNSVFEIIGPVMIGPSSSHTAGAVQLGRIARQLFGREPESLRVQFYGSFAETYRGHATDVAVVGGVLGFSADDERIRDSIGIAGRCGMDIRFITEEALPQEPNTLTLSLRAEKEELVMTGVSVGGAAVKITEVDGFALNLSAESPALLIFHEDQYGAVANVASIMKNYRLNISHMEVSRRDKGSVALMTIETDQSIPESTLIEIESQEHILKVLSLHR